MTLGQVIKRFIAQVSLTVIYVKAIIIGKLFRLVYKKKSRSNAIIINATFHNPNWFFAHIEPLARSHFGQVVLVTDEVIAEVDNLVYQCPPKWLSKVLTRAGSKAIWTLYMGIKYKGDIFIGYHIFPSAVTALVCSRILGAKCAYQVTAGELELAGGGWNAENPLMRMLQAPSPWVEKMALGLTRQFDLVVVRGSRAKRFIREGGYGGAIEVITGSVELPEKEPVEKTVDLITVGRLAEYKRPDLFVDLVAELAKTIPTIKAVMVGDGPDRPILEEKIREYGIESNIELLGQRKDVMELLMPAKIFILTSRWEGVSIAMLEAMGMGLVPVVSNVGDLADFAENDVTGFVVELGDVSSYSKHISNLLSDHELYQQLSDSAQKRVLERAERDGLSQRWNHVLGQLSRGELK